MRTREDGEAISERILAPPRPGYAQPVPQGGQENSGRPFVFLRGRAARPSLGQGDEQTRSRPKAAARARVGRQAA